MNDRKSVLVFRMGDWWGLGLVRNKGSLCVCEMKGMFGFALGWG